MTIWRRLKGEIQIEHDLLQEQKRSNVTLMQSNNNSIRRRLITEDTVESTEERDQTLTQQQLTPAP